MQADVFGISLNGHKFDCLLFVRFQQAFSTALPDDSSLWGCHVIAES